MNKKNKKIILANPRGFCAGVTRAVKTVERALEIYGEPVYVRHQIVHNKRVVNMLKKKGAKFVESLEDVPTGEVVIFSAHGVPPEVREKADKMGLKTVDATCPLVAKIHIEAKRFHENGYTVLLIGHKGHQEVVGIMGEAPIQLIESVEDINKLEINNQKKIACLTQTTLSVDETIDIIKALQEKYPDLVLPPRGDICYATQNRQRAVKDLSGKVDLIFVIGSKSSSNSNRLAEVSGGKGVLISDISEIDPDFLEDAETIGITAGASTPDIMVEEVIEYITNKYPGTTIKETEYEEENISFALPQELEKK